MSSKVKILSKGFELVPVEKLKPYNKNSRQHPKSQIEQIAKIIQSIGFTTPLLVTSDFEIIAGHGRLEAAQKIGMEEVPVTFIGDISKEDYQALVIADNQIANNAGWHYEHLAGTPSESELQKENQLLKAQVAELQKRIQELEAEQKSAASKARAEKLMAKLEKQGIAFASEEEKQTELKRLAELSDEAFSATEAAYSRIPTAKTEAKQEPDKKPEAKSKALDSTNQSVASLRPRDVDDQKSSLEDRLKNGFMAAYHNRVGNESGNNQHSNMNQ